MPTIEERALATAIEAAGRRMPGYRVMAEGNALRRSIEAHARALEAHDAERAVHAQFRQEVSDAVEEWHGRWVGAGESHSYFMSLFSRFIIPEPVDPLVEAVRDCGYATLDAIEPEFVADLRTALATRGLKLVEVGDAD